METYWEGIIDLSYTEQWRDIWNSQNKDYFVYWKKEQAL